jgi:hypothetical protein
MSSSQSRLELQIDIFEKAGQRALALPDLTPPELVDSILQEFRELEYLGDSPTDYQLFKAADKSPLDNEDQIQSQVSNAERLVLVELMPPLPAGTERPSDKIYLRELASGKVYKLSWLPAIIGRPDKNQPFDDRLAVNLETFETGLRVSRRQAMITEENGQYFVESMSRNPTSIRNSEEQNIPVTSQKQPIQPGDVILLERSNIALKFIMRSGKKAD